MTHVIRLQGFWAVTSGSAGVTHTRAFGRPRTLDPGETAWIVGTSSPVTGLAYLNDACLGDLVMGEAFAFEVTDRLEPRNRVRLVGHGDHAAGSVALEIRNLGSPDQSICNASS